MSLVKMEACSGGIPNIFYLNESNVSSDTVDVGFQPRKIYASFVFSSTPINSIYDADINPDYAVQAYKDGNTVSVRALRFSSIQSDYNMISAVSSSGFTINNLAQATDIVIVAIP